MGKVKTAIIGVGNCASSLIQGIFYYKNAKENEFVPGLMHVNLGGYHIKDIEFVCTFDINETKVGKDLSEAIFSFPNNTYKFSNVPKLGVVVHRGPTIDGLGKYLRGYIKESDEKSVDVKKILQESGADVVINFLPVGAEEATRWYIQQALEAGCGVVNAIPVFIASDPQWQRRFKEANLPIIGDDVKSQVGATILHRTIVNLFLDRGMIIDKTYQLNIGGNTDFLNMLERERLDSKKKSKTMAVLSQFHSRGVMMKEEDIHVSPSDYVEWLRDNKVCYLRIEGRHFGDVPMTLECKLSVEDSPNSAGVVIDAIRIVKLAMDNGIGGVLAEPSAYLMKSPPVQMKDDEARKKTEEFIEKLSKKS